MRAASRFTQESILHVRQAINEAQGNEVLVVGSLDDNKKICSITVAARGNEEAVPALKPYLEKGDVIVHNHPSALLKPSYADLRIAAQLGNQGIGFYIVDNNVENTYVVAEPVTGREIKALDSEELSAILEPGGKLNSCFPAYEERLSQIEMLKFCTMGFNKDLICLSEAGTGIGKSLAYLIPAFSWVLRNDERVVVSTATINLQQQLIEKDIPLVKRLLGSDPGVVLVKGRSNYLCLTRLRESSSELSLFDEVNENLNAIVEWSLTTATGSRSDLSFFPDDDLWYRLCSEADACRGLRCPERERCFVLRARREAAAARILVVNHHLLFADLSMRIAGAGFESSAVLPPFHRIIFDEAHNIEKSATSFFSRSFSCLSIARYSGRLLRQKKGRNYGLLPGLEKLLHHHNLINQIQNFLSEVAGKSRSLDAMSAQLLDGNLPGRKLNFRLTNETPEIQTLLLEPLNDLRKSIMVLLSCFEELFKGLSEEQEEESIVYECRIELRRLNTVAEICSHFLRFQDNDQDVFWLENRKNYRGENYTRFVITPLDISLLMNEAVYKPYKTVIFTSATLAVNHNFDFWKSRVGFNSAVEREIKEGFFVSPFNYKRDVLLGIPKEAPPPSEEGYTAFISAFVQEVLKISEGRALLLFTSYSMLKEVYDEVAAGLREWGINVLRQGEDDRSRLLQRFQEDTASVLLATDSFWEGVDTPGEALEVVIMCRLPFRVPTDPVIEARLEAIEKRGGNSFWELLLPDAVLRLKQGFGRLIRRKSDRGIVLILDSRIITKSYGRIFLSSLPETPQIVSESRFLLEKVENFIVNMRSNR